VSTTESADWNRAIDLNKRALELRKQGKLDETEPILREALQIGEKVQRQVMILVY